MAPIHKQLASGQWDTLSLVKQLANVDSDVARTARWYGKDQQRCEQAFNRTQELLDLRLWTIGGKAGGKNSRARVNCCATPCSVGKPTAVTWLPSTAISSSSQ
ncbi:MAG: hypothetical protein KF722_02385 [Nitrospira sp.]|nr:hypothetical protein [Nitrospira sp.]